MNNSKILYRWLTEGFIIKSTRLDIRISEECKSLTVLKNRFGFLADYDCALRYMYLYLLFNGYDLNIKSVHFAFRKFLNDFKVLSTEEINEIILGRHKLKYDRKEVPLKVKENLNKGIEMFIFYVESSLFKEYK